MTVLRPNHPFGWLRWLFWSGIAGLVGWILTVTWMRWMDPFVDFGRELYVPWRILSGEHPVKDYLHLYGPFSAYFKAALFHLFGVSVRTLVLANLVIYGAIVVCVFALVRRAFGYLAAAAATASGVVVFGFGHYFGLSNYSYAAPYAHEATHGMLFLALVLLRLGRLSRRTTRISSAYISGLLIGLAWTTKTEYVAATIAVWVGAGVRIWLTPARRCEIRGWIVGTTGGVLTVLAMAWALLALALPAGLAAKAATNALLAPFLYGSLSHTPLGLQLIGFDAPMANLLRILRASVPVLAAMGGLVALGRWQLPARKAGARWLVIGLLLASAFYAARKLNWLEVGLVFPILLPAAGWRIFATSHRRLSDRFWTQALLAVAAIVMMLRMALAPTITHYGFFQAMLAGVWLSGYLVGYWPTEFVANRRMSRAATGAGLVLLSGMTVALFTRSLGFYRQKQQPIGTGADRIYGFVPATHRLPEMWERARAHIEATSSATASLLVIPEGISLNYWTRRRHPLFVTDLLPATLALSPDDILAKLAAVPPDIVVVSSRPVTEFGFSAFGAEGDSRRLIEWVTKEYRTDVVSTGVFDRGKVGLMVLARPTP